LLRGRDTSFENMLEVREVDAEEEVQVPVHDDVDQENVTEEIADDVAQPTSPLPPSPVIPSSPPLQSPRPSPSQAAEGSSLLILKLKAQVKKLERLNKVKSSKLRRLKKVGTSQRIESSEDLENVFNQERVQEAVEIVTTAKLMTEVVTAALQLVLLFLLPSL
nr:hypothetical protein [Tanacetum cinerariifolium]